MGKRSPLQSVGDESASNVRAISGHRAGLRQMKRAVGSAGPTARHFFQVVCVAFRIGAHLNYTFLWRTRQIPLQLTLFITTGAAKM
ncbi:uncharacterized protein METZ01_LOCUS247441 [marine metagenome]|uniref:Uncharacterized protein n=1 Tax=marine metagenome TaxID=408172 RepID=A0A382I5U7_9ZZZZ